MRVDFIMWNLCESGQYTLGWNWGWGYYRSLKIMKAAGFGGSIKAYNYIPADVVIIIDPIHISNRGQMTVQSVKRMRDTHKKVIYACYETIVENDTHVMAGSKSYRAKLESNPIWVEMMKTADLLAVADPHDKWAIENNPSGIKYPPIIYSPLAVDHRLFTPVKGKPIMKACFIGSKNVASRMRYLKPIPANLIDYPRTKNDGRNINEKAKETEGYARTLAKYAINLNIRTLFAGLQMRIYETMSVGRVCVSHVPENFPGRIDLQKTLKNVVWYINSVKNPNQLGIIEAIKHVLHNPAIIKSMGDSARDEIVANHTHDIRIGQLLKEVGY